MNEHHQQLFAHALYNVFHKMRQKEDIVCMKCLKFTQVGHIPNECCKRLGFAVDPKSVVVDIETGLVTHAAPAVKKE